MSRENVEKTIGISVQTAKMTSEILKEALRAFLSGKPKHGKRRYGSIAKDGKLESIEITENNIGDFLKTARKYDIDYALKRDKSTNPPTYHVFFTASNAESFRRAFSEYAADKTRDNGKRSISSVINRETIKENAKLISEKSAQLSAEKNLSKSEITR